MSEQPKPTRSLRYRVDGFLDLVPVEDGGPDDHEVAAEPDDHEVAAEPDDHEVAAEPDDHDAEAVAPTHADASDWDGPPRPDSDDWPVLKVGPAGGVYTPRDVHGARSVRVQMPPHPIAGAKPGFVVFKNFENVHCIGGRIEMGAHNCLMNAQGLLTLADCHDGGVYYFEGLHLVADGWIGDMIRYQGAGGLGRGGHCSMYLVNSRIDGPEYGTGRGYHGDMMQVTGARHEIPALRLELFNVSAGCTGQGFMFNDRTRSGHVHGDKRKMNKRNQSRFKASRCNIYVAEGRPAPEVLRRHRGKHGAPNSLREIIKGGLKLLFLGGKDNVRAPFEVYWYDAEFGREVHVYSTVNHKTAIDLVRPPPHGDQQLEGRRGPGSAIHHPDKSITWENPHPSDCMFAGRVLSTRPAHGDFAPADAVGVHYRPDAPIWSG